MVVNLVTISEYCKSPPTVHWGEGRLKIPEGPLYEVERVAKLAQEHLDADDLNLVVPWTRRSIADAAKLHTACSERYATDSHFLAMLLTEIWHGGNYIDSEWCFNGQKAVAACDSYRVKRVERAANEKYYEVEYYLKFAIAKSGSVIFTISNHLSGAV